ncbi:MAG: DUF4358 domain-containing protein [Oscillospiraceae bacterium]|nr:DUF4358 domain-containing protein [Oscillospiraceae bacterium]
MTKKIISVALSLVVALSLFAGCGKSDKDVTNGDNMQSDVASSSSATMKKVHEQIKEAYGEDYLATMNITDKTQVSEMFGVNEADIDEFIVDIPMMSAHVDKFVAIKAKQGREQAVENALNTYLENEKQNNTNYPVNMPKINSAQVVRKGDIVYLTMLGRSNDNLEATADELMNFAKEQVKKATDVIDRLHV